MTATTATSGTEWPNSEDWVYSLQFIEGGATLVSGSEDGRAILWSVETGKAVREFDTGHWATWVSPNESVIARVGEVGDMILLRRDGSQLQSIDALDDREIYRIFFDSEIPITLSFAGGGDRRQFDVWNLETNELTRTVSLPDDFPSDFDEFWRAVIANGQVAIPTTSGSIVLFELSTGALTAELVGHPGHTIGALAFDGKGSVLATVGTDGFVRHWDVETSQQVASLQAPATNGRTISLSPEATAIVAGFGGGGGSGTSTVAIWRLPKNLDELKAAAREILPPHRDLTSEERRRFYLTAKRTE